MKTKQDLIKHICGLALLASASFQTSDGANIAGLYNMTDLSTIAAIGAIQNDIMLLCLGSSSLSSQQSVGNWTGNVDSSGWSLQLSNGNLGGHPLNISTVGTIDSMAGTVSWADTGSFGSAPLTGSGQWTISPVEHPIDYIGNPQDPVLHGPWLQELDVGTTLLLIDLEMTLNDPNPIALAFLLGDGLGWLLDREFHISETVGTWAGNLWTPTWFPEPVKVTSDFGWRGNEPPQSYTLTIGIPEPATLSLLAIGGLGLVRRRRRHK